MVSPVGHSAPLVPSMIYIAPPNHILPPDGTDTPMYMFFINDKRGRPDPSGFSVPDVVAFIARNDLEVLEELIADGCNLNEIDGINWTPMMHAIYLRDIEAQKLLLKNGVSWPSEAELRLVAEDAAYLQKIP